MFASVVQKYSRCGAQLRHNPEVRESPAEHPLSIVHAQRPTTSAVECKTRAEAQRGTTD